MSEQNRIDQGGMYEATSPDIEHRLTPEPSLTLPHNDSNPWSTQMISTVADRIRIAWMNGQSTLAIYPVGWIDEASLNERGIDGTVDTEWEKTQ